MVHVPFCRGNGHGTTREQASHICGNERRSDEEQNKQYKLKRHYESEGSARSPLFTDRRCSGTDASAARISCLAFSYHDYLRS